MSDNNRLDLCTLQNQVEILSHAVVVVTGSVTTGVGPSGRDSSPPASVVPQGQLPSTHEKKELECLGPKPHHTSYMVLKNSTCVPLRWYGIKLVLVSLRSLTVFSLAPRASLSSAFTL